MENIREFITRYPAKTYKKGETILLKDEKPDHIFIIESGFVKTYSITKNGDERLVSIDRKGDDFPIGYALGLIEKSEYFYEAFSKCTVRLVPQNEYLEYLHGDIDRMYNQQVRLTILLLATLSRVHALEQPNAREKIAHTLVYMADKLGVMLRPNKSRLKIDVTQQEIANSLGLTRETANIELKKLETMKIIQHSRKSYVLYMEKLKDYLNKQ
jgi:CRP/FNR family transcriptional regulator, cyclic AMP receptor protein